MTSSAMSWRGTCGHSLEEIVLAWEGEAHVLLFDPASGDTHLLSSLAGLLLDLLEHQVRDLDALLAEVRNTLDPDSAEIARLPGLVQQHLDQLARLGLLDELPA